MINHYPIHEVLSDLKRALSTNNKSILEAPPGAGKSTIVPLELLNEPWLAGKKIIMLEPRRLATRSVAMRMASLINQEVGRVVGYRIRFENKITSATRIEVVTEGILTRMLQHDNSLENVGLVIFDEFHERNLQTDLALALCLQAQQLLREDLRILIMSATLDGRKISAALHNAPIITSEGRQFPVTVNYLGDEPQTRLSSRMGSAIRKILRVEQGDMLVFLPGVAEIRLTQNVLEEMGVDAIVNPLYGDLPFQKQQAAILPDPKGRRKIVLATSIAETSLTIEGIRIVMDSGYSRVPKFDLRSGLTKLETVRVTKDAADQRAGRAGRLGPGLCFRLWSEGVQRNLAEHRKPEILEADLASLILELHVWGIKDVNELTWLNPPPAGAVSQALEILKQLEAVDDTGKITLRGKQMAALPTHPRLAHMLLASCEHPRTALLGTDVAAILEERDPLPKATGADLSLRIAELRNWRSGNRVVADTKVLERINTLASAWRKIFKLKEDNQSVNDYDIGSLVVMAYPERIAKQQAKHGERYKLSTGKVVKLPAHDPLVREPWLAVAQLDAGDKEGKIFLAAPLDETSLRESAKEISIVRWDSTRERVEGVLEKRVGSLVLESKPMKNIPVEERVQVLCSVIREEGLKVLDWKDIHHQWQARVMSLKHWRPNEPWPDVSDEHLLQTLDDWLVPYLIDCSKLSDLKRLDLTSILPAILPWELQSGLMKWAPERIEVPSGSRIQVNYFTDGRPPVMEVRLQEVFGLLETPAVNQGKVNVLMHLLSPGFKPVQVTQDLKSFWQHTYHDVRKELRMRYPKHAWPEDPWTAQAVKGVKKKKT
jgi:ATP-dependent helicase HrpB